jgi:alpha-beta hydrolase superfamily lysophospholipase
MSNYQFKNITKHIMMFCLIVICTASLQVKKVSAQQSADHVEENIAQTPNSSKKATKFPLSQVVRFKARSDHDFLLTADYFYLTDPKAEQTKQQTNIQATGGVIVLHDCHSNRNSYESLAKTIALQDLHTLSLDLRGYGESIAPGYSELDIKKNAKDIVSYQGEVALLTSYWQDDLLSSYEFLRTKVHKNKGIAVVASGCAGSYAVALAEKIHVSALVLITPTMGYSDKERYKNLIDIPTYFISSAQCVVLSNLQIKNQQ